MLLKFLHLFLTLIGKVTRVDILVQFAQSLPQTLYLAKSFIGIGDDLDKYVARPKCCTLYKAEECVTRRTNGWLICFQEIGSCSISNLSSEKQEETMWCFLHEANAFEEWFFILTSEESVLF